MTKTRLALALGLTLCAGGAALAQTMAPRSDATEPGASDGRGGRFNGGMERMMGRMRPSKAAFFHLQRGDARIDIKCADDEPTKACIDAASGLLDKLAPSPK